MIKSINDCAVLNNGLKMPHRINENAQIFDFELSQSDIALLDSLDQGKRVGPDPYNFDF